MLVGEFFLGTEAALPNVLGAVTIESNGVIEDTRYEGVGGDCSPIYNTGQFATFGLTMTLLDEFTPWLSATSIGLKVDGEFFRGFSRLTSDNLVDGRHSFSFEDSCKPIPGLPKRLEDGTHQAILIAQIEAQSTISIESDVIEFMVDCTLPPRKAITEDFEQNTNTSDEKDVADTLELSSETQDIQQNGNSDDDSEKGCSFTESHIPISWFALLLFYLYYRITPNTQRK